MRRPTPEDADETLEDDDARPADDTSPSEPESPLAAFTAAVIHLHDVLDETREVPEGDRVEETKDAVSRVAESLGNLYRQCPDLARFVDAPESEINNLKVRVSALERSQTDDAGSLGLSVFRISFSIVVGATVAGPLAALVPATWAPIGAETLKAAIGILAGTITAEVIRPVEGYVTRRPDNAQRDDGERRVEGPARRPGRRRSASDPPRRSTRTRTNDDQSDRRRTPRGELDR